MSTLELEHLKHTSSSTNNLSVHSDGSLTLGMLQGNVGIGTSSPSKPLHVSLPTGSGATPRATAVVVIDGNDNTQLDILGGASSILGINFGDSSDNDQARITCNTTPGSKDMAFTVNAGVRMTIDTAGRVTTPYQPGVNVAPASTESGTYNSASNNNQYCIWSSIRWQVGNSYNTSNGTFTVPITGKYYVSFHSNWHNSNAGSWIMPQVYKNGSVWEQWYQNTSGQGSWIQLQGATIVDCAQNDTIRLYKQTQSGSGGGSDVGNYSSFVVRLLG